MSVLKNVIQKIAKGYDPSITGGIGMIASMVILFGAAGAVVCAAAGAGIAALAGASVAAGALWGGGIVAGGAAALVSWMTVPQAVKAWCYKQELKDRVARGESIEGCWYVPGIEKIRPPRNGNNDSGISSEFSAQAAPALSPEALRVIADIQAKKKPKSWAP